ncbi:MAG: hypothetical protein ABW220_16000 [Burkholderiaceae bacterium]
MTFHPRSKVPVRFARALVALTCGATLLADAVAQPSAADQFPQAAMNFLNTELPQMENAVAERDRDYFEAAMGRTVEFSESWGFKTRANPALARYPMCTDAVSDFVIVGLCRLMKNGDVCEPGLAPRFDANLKRCKEMASRP